MLLFIDHDLIGDDDIFPQDCSFLPRTSSTFPTICVSFCFFQNSIGITADWVEISVETLFPHRLSLQISFPRSVFTAFLPIPYQHLHSLCTLLSLSLHFPFLSFLLPFALFAFLWSFLVDMDSQILRKRKISSVDPSNSREVGFLTGSVCTLHALFPYNRNGIKIKIKGSF